MNWIDDISLLASGFFLSFEGQLFQDLVGVGPVYQVTTGTWISPSAMKEKRSYAQNLHRFLAQAGNARFQAVGGSHDLFFNQEVRVTGYNLLWEEPYPFQSFGFDDYEFWTNGTKHSNPDLQVPLCNPVIFGMYEDDYNRILNTQCEYEVTIYIHYEI